MRKCGRGTDTARAANRLLTGFTSLLFAGGSALAADLPAKAPAYVPAPVFNWSGLYGGIHGGWGWGDVTYVFPPGGGGPGIFAPITGGSFGKDIDGGVLGGHFGGNYQVGNWVAGLEGSVAWTGLKGTATDPFGPSGGITTYDSRLKWLATLTPRLGYAANNWLLYVKGGLAAGEVDSDLELIFFNPAAFREKNDHLGWTVGVGVEYAWTPNWIFGLEYNYYDLGHQLYGGRTSDDLGDYINYRVDLKFSAVLARLSYRWDEPAHAVPAIPVKAPVFRGDWTGPYGGVHGGWGWGDADYTFPAITTAFATPGGAFSQDIDGGVFGGHLGYNFQEGNWLVGLEGSLAWSGLDGSSRDVFAPAIAPTVTYDTKLNWLATVTPRLGYAANNGLLYVKGGLAAGEAESRLRSTAAAAILDEKSEHVGWTAGIGIEYAWMPNWVVGLEYNYYDLGEQRYGPIRGGVVLRDNYGVDLKFSTVLARMSYKFGAPITAR